MPGCRPVLFRVFCDDVKEVFVKNVDGRRETYAEQKATCS